MFNITNANNFHMTFANGYTISIAWNGGNYCSNRDMHPTFTEPRACATVEVAAWGPDGVWVRLGDNEAVVGWQSADEVVAIMAKVAAL